MARSELTFSNAAKLAPPQAWFAISAIFHYLGPSFAVLLFPSVGVLGVAWMRIAAAAAIFAPWTTPWRTIARADGRTRRLLIGLGICLAVMNTAFYLALDRLPMSLVAAIEFVGHDRRRALRPAQRAQSGGARARGSRRVSLDQRPMVERSDRALLGFSEWRAVCRLHRARAQDIGSGRERRRRAPWRGDGDRVPHHLAHRISARLCPRSETRFWCSREPASGSAHP